MQAIKLINQALAFLLELLMFAALAFYGFRNGKTVFSKTAFAIVLPLAAIVLWGIFAAPRSAHRLQQPYRMLFELTLFLTTAFLLYRTGNTATALGFGLLALVSELVALALKQ